MEGCLGFRTSPHWSDSRILRGSLRLEAASLKLYFPRFPRSELAALASPASAPAREPSLGSENELFGLSLIKSVKVGQLPYLTRAWMQCTRLDKLARMLPHTASL